jgi:predicted transcriptional regulator of viral defense system
MLKQPLSSVMKTNKSKFEEDIEIVNKAMKEGQILKWSQLKELGVRQSSLVSMTKGDEPILERIGWGTYKLSFDHRMELQGDFDEDEIADIADDSLEDFLEVTSRSKRGVICLLSAVNYYNLSTSLPSRTWLALPHGSHPPKIDYPPIKPVFWRNHEALSLGVVHKKVNGMTVPITNLERTVVDLFKYASRLPDSSIAKEALQTAMQRPDFCRKRLGEYAYKLGVASRIRAEIESIDKYASGPAYNYSDPDSYRPTM